MCLKKSGHAHYDELGFRQLPNEDNDDSDDLESAMPAKNTYPMKTQQKYSDSPVIKEYHDELSSDEEGENNLFHQKLIREGKRESWDFENVVIYVIILWYCGVAQSNW